MLTTVLVMTVSAWTTPLNFAIPALRVTMLADISTMGAFTDTLPGEFMLIPAGFSIMALSLVSAISIEPGLSRRENCCPSGVSRVSDS